MFLRNIRIPKFKPQKLNDMSISKSQGFALTNKSKVANSNCVKTSLGSIFKRNILSLAEYKNTSFSNNSLLEGIVTNFVGDLEQLYKASINENPSPVSIVVRELFHRVNVHDPLLPTANKSKPGYGFTPTILGYIISNLKKGTLDQEDVIKKIIYLVNEEVKKKCGGKSKISASKTRKLLNLIVQSKSQENESGIDKRFNIESVLKCFLHHKAITRHDLVAYFAAFYDDESSNALINPEDIYLADEFLKIKYDILEILKISGSKPELAKQKLDEKKELLNLFLISSSLPRVLQSSYGFRGQTPRPNCVETSVHNLLNFLCFNRSSNSFDISLLPKNVVPIPEFVEFYTSHSLAEVNNKQVGQHMMNLLSDIRNIYYSINGNYELCSMPYNYLHILNYLFNLTAANFTELSHCLSDVNRQVVFRLKPLREGYYDLEIAIYNGRQCVNFMMISILPGHASIPEVGIFERNKFAENLISLIPLLVNHINEYQTTLFLILKNFSVQAVYDHFFKIKILNPDILLFIFNYFYPKNIKEANQLFEKTMPHIDKFAKQMKSLVKNFEELRHEKIYINYLIQENVDLNDYDESILFGFLDDEKMITLLLERGIKIQNNKSHTPILHEAIENASVLTIQNLIKAGANIDAQNKYGRTPLHAAATSESSETLKLLIDAGANIEAADEDGITPLCFAASSKNSETVKLLIDAGVNIHSVSKKGTALHFAVNADSENNVTLLINAGANINIKDEQGKSSLHYAVDRYSEKSLKLLINAGAKIDIQDNEGKTPLHYAITTHVDEFVQLLINAGANLDVTDKQGNTPLHCSVLKGDMQISKLLIYAGTELNIQNNKEISLLHFVFKYFPWPKGIFNEEEIDTELILYFISRGLPLDYYDSKDRCSLDILIRSFYRLPESTNLDLENFFLRIDLSKLQLRKSTCISILKMGSSSFNLTMTQLLMLPSFKNLMKEVDFLKYFVTYESAENFRTLLNQDINIKSLDEYGESVFDWIFDNTFTDGPDQNLIKMEKLKILIEAGVDLNLKNRNGKNALLVALQNFRMVTDIEVIKLLIQKFQHDGNKDVFTPALNEILDDFDYYLWKTEENGQLPFFRSWRCSRFKDYKTIIQLLIDYGADTNSLSVERGKTLIDAIGLMSLIKERGVLVNVKEVMKEKAMDLVIKRFF